VIKDLFISLHFNYTQNYVRERKTQMRMFTFWTHLFG